MSYKYVYKDRSLFCDEFHLGLVHLEQESTVDALRCFQLAYESVKNSDTYHNKYASFCGVLRVMQGDYGGLILCRDVARGEKKDGDVYFNLARAEWHRGSRKKTVEAIFNGLSVDARHYGLQQMQKDLGVRKRNPLPVLKRDNYLNATLGRIIRKVK